MSKVVIKPFNVVDQCELPETAIDNIPTDGDPVEIDGELYYVCQDIDLQHVDPSLIGVIPLVVRNPANVLNIQSYIKCLSLAHRRVQFKNSKGICDIDTCEEMIIT